MSERAPRYAGGTLTVAVPPSMQLKDALAKFSGRCSRNTVTAAHRLRAKGRIIKVPSHAMRQFWNLTGGWKGKWYRNQWFSPPAPDGYHALSEVVVNPDLSVMFSHSAAGENEVPVAYIRYRGEFVANMSLVEGWHDQDKVYRVISKRGRPWFPAGFDEDFELARLRNQAAKRELGLDAFDDRPYSGLMQSLLKLRELTGGWERDLHVLQKSYGPPKPSPHTKIRRLRLSADLEVYFQTAFLTGWLVWRGKDIAYTQNGWKDKERVRKFIETQAEEWWPEDWDPERETDRWEEHRTMRSMFSEWDTHYVPETKFGFNGEIRTEWRTVRRRNPLADRPPPPYQDPLWAYRKPGLKPPDLDNAFAAAVALLGLDKH
jgi:hypothetical protein